ncbi:MAG: leucine-rich repeat protein [Clostridia bacterium]|nr:leucine-rich repeat protein [Clostridia bacterium]
MTTKTKFARSLIGGVSLLMALVLLLGALITAVGGTESAGSTIRLLEETLITNRNQFFDNSVVYELPDTVKDTDIISLILKTDEESLLDAYEKSGSKLSFTEYVLTDEAAAVKAKIAEENAALLALLDAAAVKYGTGVDYDTVLSGLEITVQAADFKAVCTALGDRATTIVSEVYNVAETQLVENKVNVYDTGIFNSSSFAYDGTGMVVAVLDTGLDYYHTAFSLGNFTADRSKLGLTFAEVSALVGGTRANGMQSGLTASDVYVSDKVPFGFDYADGDSDVFPINSDHGTHVAGIIAGKDDTITGVAPNAQLVIMKTFSDVKQTALASWILAALEDCVVLGVDVINMSLGTGCGFSRPTDREALSGVYDRIKESGISLIVAASNSYNSTYGSEKNGNLGLTSNPDSATVGSPGTYAGALSIASINGVKTPYILYNNTIIYFQESNNRVSDEKHFVDELLVAGSNEIEIEYITIPGAGRSADYTGIDVTNKIVLVSRGSTTFEEKANVAQQKGAAGIIIYNNVSGDIKMNVGDTTIPVCSISQDHGELLAAAGTGKIKVSRSQTSGPFMSDFSSWGPTPDLQLKPEITAHGGYILSSVPGQDYDRISGTSMATPNVSGLAALLRQYVKSNFPDIADNNIAVTNLVNQLMMSTADIILNKNGLPYSVRKQGAGLANLDSCALTPAYIITYNRVTGEAMDKTKIELGDDPQKTGKYTLKFSIKNFGNSTLSYDLSAIVMTEGVSDTKTHQGETTVTEEGYILDGAVVKIESGSADGKTVTVAAGATADVTVTITLSDADKAYLDASFENGMYVEGFLKLTAKSGTTVNLNVPYLGFYGDWTESPLFDLDYFETNKDELDDAIDVLDKTLPDAYASRPVGGLSDDYVSFLGSYYFEQAPGSTKIAADRKYISLSNQADTVNSLRFVWMGLLRNAAKIEITITEDATGEVVFSKIEDDVRKSYGDGGTIYPANVEVEFSAIEENLKNNTAYTVKLQGYVDYGNGGLETNDNNVFEFPFRTDFSAPTVTGCDFYTEYDRAEKKTRLFARVAVYDNHYAMSMQMGYVGMASDGSGYMLNTFGEYMTPVYSEFNGTSYVTYELTDYVDIIRSSTINRNTFTVVCYDYALNQAAYEIPLPDDFADFYFEEAAEGLTLSPNQVYTLAPKVYPGGEWPELLEFSSLNPAVATVVNNKLVAVAPGKARIAARDPSRPDIEAATFMLTVLAEGEEGFVRYDKPVLDTFTITGYHTDKAFFMLSSPDRELGETGDERKFNNDASCALTMYTSEAVTLRYRLDAYFPDATEVTFESSNNKVATVDENGSIVAVGEGFASISIRVLMDGKSTFYSKSVSIEVKDPYVTTGPSITHYYGNGGVVQIPASLAVTEIGQFAFSNFNYIPKEPWEITEEEKDATKIWFIGEDTIEEVIVPEGVETIGPYAFAGLTSLKKITLPSTIVKVDYGAFYGCTALETVQGLENAKFINQHAFYNCDLRGTLTLKRTVAVADYAFFGNENLAGIALPENTQSVGAYAFAGCTSVSTLTMGAEKIKLGQYAFSGCAGLTEVTVNAAVVPTGTFSGCSKLASVTFGRDVAVIGEYAFRGTKVERFTVDAANTDLKLHTSGHYLTNGAGDMLVLALPAFRGELMLGSEITAIGNGAFSGHNGITAITAPAVTRVGNYAFADAERLATVNMPALNAIGEYGFCNTAVTAFVLKNGMSLGKYAFAGSKLTTVNVPDGFTVSEGAFCECEELTTVIIGNGATIGDYAFHMNRDEFWRVDNFKDENGVRHYYYVYLSNLKSLTVGSNVTIGDSAFFGACALESVTLGDGAVIGDQAFYNAGALRNIDLSKVVSVGNSAFSGDVLYLFANSGCTVPSVVDGNYVYRYYAPVFTSVDLSAATGIGEDAFAYCRELTTVQLGAGIKEIPDRAFGGADKLSTINTENVEVIGDNAFSETALTEIDLSSAVSIGEYAFVYVEELARVIFGEHAFTVGEGAFSYCKALAETTNLALATQIADYAFAYTALTEADLSGATHIGTNAFMKETVTDFTVKLGKGLVSIGDNPFAMCRLAPFSSVVVESFNGTDYEIPTHTYDISDTVKVVDGSLYRVVPNGLVLITYAGDAESVQVAAGTVRIGAMAFAGADVVKVMLPYTVESIGHKAFFGCESLSMVSFASFDAPILEEEYDYYYYVSGDNVPATGNYTFMDTDGITVLEKPGLGIVPYFMWNAADLATNIYYGANFVDYIGHIEQNLVMVRPANGKNYESFIFGQYFNVVVDGANAADDVTLAAIAAINKLPERVSLSDKALVQLARAAYDKVASLEQRALVTEYAKLTQAEKRIADLEYLQSEEQPAPEEPPVDTPMEEEKLPTAVVVAIVLGVCFGLAAGAAAVFAFLYFKGGKGGPKTPSPCQVEKCPAAAAEEATSEAPADPATESETNGEDPSDKA